MRGLAIVPGMRPIPALSVLPVLLALTLSACGGDTPDPAPSASAPTTVAPSEAPKAEAWETVPAADRKAFLRAVALADKGLVDGDPQKTRALRRAVYTCTDLADGKPKAKVLELLAFRFTGGHGKVSAAEAEKLLPVIKKRICTHTA